MSVFLFVYLFIYFAERPFNQCSFLLFGSVSFCSCSASSQHNPLQSKVKTWQYYTMMIILWASNLMTVGSKNSPFNSRKSRVESDIGKAVICLSQLDEVNGQFMLSILISPVVIFSVLPQLQWILLYVVQQIFHDSDYAQLIYVVTVVNN